MINCDGRNYHTFQEAVEAGELKGQLGDFKVTRYDGSTFLHSYDVYVELTDHLKDLYAAFPEEYLSVIGKTDDTFT